MDEELQALLEASHWIRVTRLQIRRFVDNFIDYAESQSRDATLVAADGHFLLNACALAEKSLKRAGLEISQQQALTIRSLRNVHEHWEQHKKSFESTKSPKARAGLTFSNEHPDQLPWSFKFDGTGTFISALRLEDLWNEIGIVERRLRSLIEKRGASESLPEPEEHGDFPKRESKLLAIAIVTQNIVLDFEPMSPEESAAFFGQDQATD